MTAAGRPDFDAIVLSTTSRVKTGGLACAERGRRVAKKAGATDVLVVTEETPAAEVTAFAARHPERALVVVDAIEYVVHTPLIQAVIGEASAICVDDHQKFDGCLWAAPDRRTELAAVAHTRGNELATLAATWRTAGVPSQVHGDIARHPARTPAERRAATHFLFGLVRKAQDTWLVRTINRKVSYPFTRLMLPTALTPNMISIGVFIMGVIGCIILTQPGYWPPVYGTGLLLFAGYLDGCDGEIARIKLESSPLGAWIDTMADEATTVISAICLGIHAYNELHLSWVLGAGFVAGGLALFDVYCVYYYLLSTGGSGNSQDYPTSGGLLDFLRLFVRREMINLGSAIFAIFGGAVPLFFAVLVGGVVSASILAVQHVKLRREVRGRRLEIETTRV